MKILFAKPLPLKLFRRYIMKHFTLKTLFVLFAFFAGSIVVSAQKMNAADVIAKHLGSIGAKEKRASIKNQVIFTDFTIKIKGSSSAGSGRSVIVSTDAKNLWGLSTNTNDYPTDKFSYDGDNVKTSYIRPGVRSVLSGFIYSYPELLREGLLGGPLLSSWSLLNIDLRKPKVSFEGTKKIDQKETYVLGYSTKGASDLTIRMYFDTSNYQLVRTEYSAIIAARQGSNIDNSAGQSADRFSLVEDFSDYKNLGGLNLPSSYKISYKYSGNSAIQLSQNSNREIEWNFKVTNYSFNQPLEANTFDINSK